MDDWKHLTEGLEIPNRKGSIPQELIERLDLVYYLGNYLGNIEESYPLNGIDLQHSVENISGVVIEVRKILMPKYSYLSSYVKVISCVKVIVSDGGMIRDYTDRSEIVKKMEREDKTLDELFIFGAILEPGLGDFAAIPVFCLGKRPEGKDIRLEGKNMGDLRLRYTSYQGLSPINTSDDSLIIINQNEGVGRIDVYPDGKADVYFGGARTPSHADAVMFDQLVPFDLEKRLILARSPNGSMSFDALHSLELSEGNGKFEYALIYDNVKQMREDRTWAINTPRGLNWEQNYLLDHFTSNGDNLDLFTKEE